MSQFSRSPAHSGILKSTFEFLDANNNPRLGESADHSFSQSKIRLQPGDKLFLYTDGAYDLRNDVGREFGFRRLSKLFDSDASESPIDSLNRITQALSEWRGDGRLNDDVTIAVVSYLRAAESREARAK